MVGSGHAGQGDEDRMSQNYERLKTLQLKPYQRDQHRLDCGLFLVWHAKGTQKEEAPAPIAARIGGAE